MTRLAGLLLIVLAAAGCSSPRAASFPVIGPLPEERVLEVLRTRVESVRSLSASLDVSYDGPEARGAFEASLAYRAPGEMRLTAFKDLIVTSSPIFDLVLTPAEFALEMPARDGAPAVKDRGPIGDLATRHPRFAAFAWAREALFLAGLFDPGEPATARSKGDGTARVEGRLPSGAAVTWTFAERTLEVTAGKVAPPRGGAVKLEYRDWREKRGAFVPASVLLDEPEARALTRIRVRDLDVNR